LRVVAPVYPLLAVRGSAAGDLKWKTPAGLAAGHRTKLIVATSHFGNKYVKTERDGEQPDNLLSLPECH
jgi:hypothetical protein